MRKLYQNDTKEGKEIIHNKIKLSYHVKDSTDDFYTPKRLR